MNVKLSEGLSQRDCGGYGLGVPAGGTGMGFELGPGMWAGVLTGGPSWQCRGGSGSQGGQTREGMSWNKPMPVSLPTFARVTPSAAPH